MMAISHALVGVTIAKAVPEPLLAGVLIITSHYLMDLIPHWDFGTDWKSRSVKMTGILAIADTLISYLVVFVLFGSTTAPLTIFLAASLSNLPDWLIAPYFMFFSSKDGYHKSRGGIFGSLYGRFLHFEETYIHTKALFTQGVLTQIVTVVFFHLLITSNK